MTTTNQNKNQLPEGWKWVKLGDSVQVLDNLRKPINSSERQKRIAGKKSSELFPYYGATGQVGLIDDFITSGEYVLVGEDGAPFLDFFKEKAYKITGRSWVNNHAHILQGISDISCNDYILHYLNSIDYKEYVNGTTRLKLTKGNLVEIPFPLPPLLTQLLIVSKIESLFTQLDKGIESLRSAQQQLKIYRQAVLKWAFEGRLTNDNVKDGELPEGWEIKKIGDYIENICAGKSIKCDERPPKIGEIGIVKVSAVTWGVFDEMASKTCYSKEVFNKNYLIKKGDFLFSRANTIELIGACVIVNNVNMNLMLSDKILRFDFTQNILKEYVLYFLKSLNGRKQIEKLSTGNQYSMRNIGQDKIKNILLPICTSIEQNKIVKEIESRWMVADKIEQTIIQSLHHAEALKQSILKMAFEGRLM